jgi:hypothetical protein
MKKAIVHNYPDTILKRLDLYIYVNSIYVLQTI